MAAKVPLRFPTYSSGAPKPIPENAARFLHGRAAYENRDYTTAIDDLSKVIEQKPDWPEAYRHRGLAYSKAGAPERAAAGFQSAIKLDPSLMPAYNGLGQAYMALGRLELAKQNLDQAIKLEPDFVLARENRAKLFAKVGDLPVEQNELALISGLVTRSPLGEGRTRSTYSKAAGSGEELKEIAGSLPITAR
jgi:tetratricopeptide (TPR) repeat protein